MPSLTVIPDDHLEDLSEVKQFYGSVWFTFLKEVAFTISVSFSSTSLNFSFCFVLIASDMSNVNALSAPSLN